MIMLYIIDNFDFRPRDKPGRLCQRWGGREDCASPAESLCHLQEGGHSGAPVLGSVPAPSFLGAEDSWGPLLTSSESILV